MFLTAVIFIIYFSLSDLAKWMSQNGATDKEKFFVVGGIFLLILFFSLSDLAKWMNQNGATDKQKLFVFGGIFVLIVVIVNLLAIAGAS